MGISGGSKDTYVPTVAVAAVDILGLQGLLSKPDQCLSAMNALGLFVANASSGGLYGSPDLRGKREDMYELDHYFGDSVYLFGDAKLELDVQVHRLSIKVATLIRLGLWG
jgi:hypothetical protein